VYLFPIHLSGHWILYIVSRIGNTIFTYLADLLNSRDINTAFYNKNLITKAISQYFSEFANYGDEDINKVAMTLRYATMQPDQTACGYYVCTCANLFLLEYLTSFMTEDELIPLTYEAAHNVRISMHKFLQDLKTVIISHLKHLNKPFLD
jgi:Ulp1 family protease